MPESMILPIIILTIVLVGMILISLSSLDKTIISEEVIFLEYKNLDLEQDLEESIFLHNGSNLTQYIEIIKTSWDDDFVEFFYYDLDSELDPTIINELR